MAITAFVFTAVFTVTASLLGIHDGPFGVANLVQGLCFAAFWNFFRA